MKRSVAATLAVSAVLVSSVGCRHVGPQSVVNDRLAYNQAIAVSWKEQALLNIVRDRYYDIVEFVDVGSITHSYQNDFTGTATLGSMIFPGDSIKNVLSPGLGGGRSFSERPNITYTPQTGADFMRNVLNPIPVASLASLTESGMRAEVVLGLAVEGINGLNNAQTYRGHVRPADPEFDEAVRILTDAQSAGLIGFRQTPATEKAAPAVYLTILDKDLPPAQAQDLARFRQLLRLDPARREFKVVHGVQPQANDEIAIRTRSVSRLINHLSTHVEVPVAHLTAGLAPDQGEGVAAPRPPITVRSGPCRPADSFAAVFYRGYWFWIDADDTESKRTMTYLKRFQSLADTGPRSPPPVLTIRAN